MIAEGMYFYSFVLFLLVYMVLPVIPAPQRSISAIHRARLVLSPVFTESSESIFESLSLSELLSLSLSSEVHGAGFSSTVNVVSAVPLSDTIPIVCSPAGRVAT